MTSYIIKNPGHGISNEQYIPYIVFRIALNRFLSDDCLGIFISEL